MSKQDKNTKGVRPQEKVREQGPMSGRFSRKEGPQAPRRGQQKPAK